MLGQVNIKLINEDLWEWVTGIQQGIANIENPPHKLATWLAERVVTKRKGGKKVHQSALSESSTVNSPGVVNHFHIGFAGSISDQQITPILASQLPLLSSSILSIYRPQGINRTKDLKEFFKY